MVNDQGEILKEIRERSKGIWDGPRYIEQLEGLARQLLDDDIYKDKEISGLGIGTCGQVNLKGELFGHNGDPSIRINPQVPIAEALSKKLSIPVKVVNDGQAAIYGEAIYGAGKDVQNVVGFTIGTGIGGGIVLNKKIFQGAQGIAGHLGFLIIDFMGKPSLAGVPGVAEDFGSGTSIGRIAREHIAADPERGAYMIKLAGGNPNKVTGFQVFEAIKNDDPLAKEIIAFCAKAIGAAAVSMIHALNPDIILLSGGVAEQGNLLVNPIREYVQFSNETMDALLTGKDYCISVESLEKEYDVYLQVSQENLNTYAPLLTMILQTFLSGFTKRRDTSLGANNRPILVLMDEFPQLTFSYSMVNTALSTLRSKSI